jgi:pyruvate dehydrogenase E2 component (dihydrolipoamide acetyltransferase)
MQLRKSEAFSRGSIEMSVYNLPELGEGLEEGEIVGWSVNVGDNIQADQTMVEVMTDKATVQVPSPAAGVVKKLYYSVGDMATVGGPLIEIEESSGASVAKPQAQVPAETPSQASVAQAAPAAVPPAVSAMGAPTNGSSTKLASPAVRKMARELNVDLGMLQGSGERGRILKSDLASVSSAAAATPARTPTQAPASSTGVLEERIPFVGIRRKIADRLSQSKFTAVHFNHFEEMDMTEVMNIRKEANAFSQKAGLGVKITYLPFFIKASIAAMKKYPILNSSLDEEKGEVVIKHYYHFGISVQTDSGLMVAVIRDCDKKNIFELAEEIKETADRARAGKATREELTGSTITITNPGSIGGIFANPVINYPETVILGMFGIKKRPIVKEVNGQEMIVARPMMYTNITCDHRVVDGAIAAGYLRLFCEYMESPAKIAFF